MTGAASSLRAMLLLGSMWVGTSAVAVEPLVRVKVEPERVRVGEPVQLEVRILVPTWFTSPARYPSFELANAVTRLPPDSSFPSSERVNGANWSGITRHYQVFPLLGARYRFEGQQLEVSFFDSDAGGPRTVSVPVPGVEFAARVPAGAEDIEPYLAGTRVELSRELEGDPESLLPGDALVASYRLEVDGLPAIFLPPIVSVPEATGLSVYPGEVDLTEDPLVARSERVTFVFEQEGRFLIPGVALSWWNTDAERVETATVTALEVVVGDGIVDSAAAVPAETSPSRIDLVLIVGVLLSGMVLIGVGAPLLRWLRARLASRRLAWRASEAYAFAELRAALGARDARRVHVAVNEWLRRRGGMTLREFVQRSGDGVLRDGVDTLLRHCYGSAGDEPDYAALDEAFMRARKTARVAPHGMRESLPVLNPRVVPQANRC